MQEVLETAARWYIRESGFTLEEMQKELRAMVAHRHRALRETNLEQINKAFVSTEIVKAAICLTIGEEYETSFSRFELSLIKKYSNGGKSTFVCPKCGREYPAEAFAPNSRFCISCEREIRLLRQKAQKARTGGYINRCGEKAQKARTGGYINRCGEIICAAE